MSKYMETYQQTTEGDLSVRLFTSFHTHSFTRNQIFTHYGPHIREVPGVFQDRYTVLNFMLYLFKVGFPHFHENVNFWILNTWMSEKIGGFDPEAAIELMEQKRQDYGELPFEISGTLGVMARTADKVCRAERLIRSEKQNFESLEDTYQDWFNYSLVALNMLEKQDVWP